MTDRMVSINALCAAALWLATLVLLGSEIVVLLTAQQRPEWVDAAGDAGVLCGLTAATLTVRGWFIEHSRRMRETFNYGREVGRDEVAALRSVQ